MRKVICLLIVVLTTSICMGQTKKKIGSKPKDIDRDINFKLDSLSNVYKMKIYSYGTVSDDGIPRHFVGYIEGNELKKKIIPKPVK
jgi:hypothetical protein